MTIYLVQIRYIWCTNTRYSVFDTPKSYLRLLFCYLFFRSRARSTSALPTKAAPPLPFAVGEPAQSTLYLFLTKSRRGELQKICKGRVLGWGAARLAVLGGAAKLFSFRLKTGSNLGVKSHHKGFILHSDLK